MFFHHQVATWHRTLLAKTLPSVHRCSYENISMQVDSRLMYIGKPRYPGLVMHSCSCEFFLRRIVRDKKHPMRSFVWVAAWTKIIRVLCFLWVNVISVKYNIIMMVDEFIAWGRLRWTNARYHFRVADSAHQHPVLDSNSQSGNRRFFFQTVNRYAFPLSCL